MTKSIAQRMEEGMEVSTVGVEIKPREDRGGLHLNVEFKVDKRLLFSQRRVIRRHIARKLEEMLQPIAAEIYVEAMKEWGGRYKDGTV